MKDSYYFPHDYHARHDPKMQRLIMTIGCEGVGIYWCLVEMLYEEGGSLPIKDIEIYAKSLNTTPEKISQTLSEFKLFVKNKTHFYSIALTKRLKHINRKREKARVSAKLSHSANADRTQTERSAIKESKVKESKEKKVYNRDDFCFFKNEVFEKTFTSYLEMRVKNKKPATERAEELVLKSLHKFPIETAIAMLEKSIVSNWTDVYELKNKEQVKSGTTINRPL